jgi:hypothetical protein
MVVAFSHKRLRSEWLDDRPVSRYDAGQTRREAVRDDEMNAEGRGDPDPLTSLVVDEAELAREELADVLRPYLRFTGSGSLVMEPEFDRITTAQQVCCVLLALRAAHLMGLRERPGATPREIVELSGMAPGSVRPKLSRLLRDRVLAKEGDDYLVPAQAMRRGAALVSGASSG